MKAVRCHRWGGPEVLVLEEVEARRPGPGEVRIAVRASGVNFTDTLVIAGKYQFKPPLPHIPGHELAGVVLETGEGIGDFQRGDRVMVSARYGGGFAEEFVAVQEKVHKIPDNMDFQTAAGFIIGHGTAFFALRYRGVLEPDETLLVNGAGGGVGLAAVEIGKTLGARVIACASSAEKLALARAHGADLTINYTTENVRDVAREFTGDKGVDVVFDPVGGDAFDQALRTVGWHARMLIVGFAAGRFQQIPANIVLVKNIAVMSSLWGAEMERDPQFARAVLREALALYEHGKIRPAISKAYPLSAAAEALTAMMSRKTLGKTVIMPSHADLQTDPI